MSGSKWSVRLAVEEKELRELSRTMSIVLSHEVRYVVISPASSDYGDEPPTVTFELEALDGRNARILAQHLLGLAKKEARLPVVPSPVVWVAPLLETDGSSHRFLEQAKDFIESELFDLAVVAAQIHLELQVAAIVRCGDVRPLADRPETD